MGCGHLPLREDYLSSSVSSVHYSEFQKHLVYRELDRRTFYPRVCHPSSIQSSRNTSCTQNQIGGLFILECIIRPVFRVPETPRVHRIRYLRFHHKFNASLRKKHIHKEKKKAKDKNKKTKPNNTRNKVPNPLNHITVLIQTI